MDYFSEIVQVVPHEDFAGSKSESECIDIDPETLYSLPETVERIA